MELKITYVKSSINDPRFKAESIPISFDSKSETFDPLLLLAYLVKSLYILFKEVNNE